MRGQIDNILHTQKILFILCGQIEINLHTQKILFIIIIIYLSIRSMTKIKIRMNQYIDFPPHLLARGGGIDSLLREPRDSSY